MICYLVRHGKDNDTVRGGWSRYGLTEFGKVQVQELVEQIDKQKNALDISQIFSSDLPRAAETAEPIAQLLNLPIEFRPEFRETNNGIFAGMPNNIATEKYPDIYWSNLEWDEPYPEGESPHQFYKRIKSAWDNLSKEMILNNKNTILVTHGGVINVIFHLITGTTFSNKERAEKISHAALIPLEFKNSIWRRI